MSNNTLIIPTEVEGNVTSCKIESTQISREKKSPWSFTQKGTYQSYDVCTKTVVQEYTVPEFTLFGGVAAWSAGMSLLLVPFLLYVIVASINDRRKGVWGDSMSHY